jgi:hypothetical protein
VRLVATSFVLLGLAAPAMAQQAGSFALDAMTTQGRHFGAGYYITNGLSVRPSLGFGYSGQFGTTLNLGADARWEVLTGSRVSPYIGASYNFLRSPYLTQVTARGTETSNVSRYGAGVGVRTRILRRLSAVAEARVLNSALRTASGTGAYGQQFVDPGAHVEAALGLSYVFN